MKRKYAILPILFLILVACGKKPPEQSISSSSAVVTSKVTTTSEEASSSGGPHTTVVPDTSETPSSSEPAISYLDMFALRVGLKDGTIVKNDEVYFTGVITTKDNFNTPNQTCDLSVQTTDGENMDGILIQSVPHVIYSSLNVGNEIRGKAVVRSNSGVFYLTPANNEPFEVIAEQGPAQKSMKITEAYLSDPDREHKAGVLMHAEFLTAEADVNLPVANNNELILKLGTASVKLFIFSQFTNYEKVRVKLNLLKNGCFITLLPGAGYIYALNAIQLHLLDPNKIIVYDLNGEMVNPNNGLNTKLDLSGQGSTTNVANNIFNVLNMTDPESPPTESYSYTDTYAINVVDDESNSIHQYQVYGYNPNSYSNQATRFGGKTTGMKGAEVSNKPASLDSQDNVAYIRSGSKIGGSYNGISIVTKDKFHGKEAIAIGFVYIQVADNHYFTEGIKNIAEMQLVPNHEHNISFDNTYTDKYYRVLITGIWGSMVNGGIEISSLTWKTV